MESNSKEKLSDSIKNIFSIKKLSKARSKEVFDNQKMKKRLISQKPLEFPIKRKHVKKVYFPSTNEIIVKNHFDGIWASPEPQRNDSLAYPTSLRESKFKKK